MGQRVVFLIGFICVFLGGVGLYLQLQNGQAVTNQDDKPIEVEKKIRMILSNQDLPKGTLLQPEQFRYAYVNESEALENGILEDQTIRFETGMLLARGISENEYLRHHFILSKEADNYINVQLTEGVSPYVLKVSKENFYGTGINVGDLVDVVVMTSAEENIGESGNNGRIESFRTLSVSPLVTQAKVLNVDDLVESTDELLLTLALSRNDIAKMIIATKIGLVEVFLANESVATSNSTNARTQDVLSDYQSVLELRGSKVSSQ